MMQTQTLTVGQTATRSLTTTAEHVELYAQITGDRNPLHFDADYAAKTRFERLIVHGGITAGLLNAVCAEQLPGPGGVFMSQQLEYLAPVYIGDTITATVTVKSVHETKPVCCVAVKIERQDGVAVLQGECWCYQLPTT